MPIPLTCAGCQSSFEVPDHLAGKKIRCTTCKAEMTVSLADEPVLELGPSVEPAKVAYLPEDDPPPPRRRRYDDEDDDDRDRGRRGRGRREAPRSQADLLIGICVAGFLVLAGAVVGGY